MWRRPFLQVTGAVLLGLNVGIPMALDAQGLFPNWSYQYHFILGFVAFAIYMSLIIRDKQMQINKSREIIRLSARPSSLAINYPSKTEKPLSHAEVSIKATIQFEIWADVDVHTAKLVLNVVGIRYRRWWRLFQTSKRLFHIARGGYYDPIYRKQIKVADAQPFEDHATFEWRGWREIVDWGDSFLLELALETGSPAGIWRVVVDPKLYERGVATPL